MASRLGLLIPEILAADLLKTKEKNLVYGNLANRNYEGTISGFGDRVRITQIGNIDINTYTRNSTSNNTAQFLDDAALYLDIDQAKYFDMRIDDVDTAQAYVNFRDEAIRKAGYRLNETADAFLAGLYTQCAITQNSSNSPVDMTSTNVEDEFLTVGQLMDEANAPRQNRFAVIAPWVMVKLVKAKILSQMPNDKVYEMATLGNVLPNGFVGTALGFNFYVSNNINKDSTAWADTKIICGCVNESITFAEQLVSVETFRDPNTFSDKVRGLHVYGGRIIAPDITACLFADKTAEG